MIHIFYHANCYDGQGALWSAQRFLKAKKLEATYEPATYGGKLSEVKNKLVVFIDFCPLLPELETLQKDNLVIVLDHHKTAQQNLVGVKKLDFDFDEVLSRHASGEKGSYCLFDMEQSGAGIAYRYFFQTDVVPNMIRLIEDRDIWRFKYKESKDFHSYLLSKPFGYDSYQKIFLESSERESFNDIIKKGSALTEYSDQIVAKICELASFQTINGLKCGFVNTTSHWAEVGEYMINNFGLDYSVAFTIDYKLGMIKGSIRRPKDLDCTPLAQHFGGGGHKGAAGFSVSMSKGPEQLIHEIEEFLSKGK